MSQLINREQQTVRVYACGGAGSEVGKLLLDLRVENDKQAKIELSFVDTSKSNVEGVEHAKTYLIEGLDGSGQKRALNASTIQKQVKQILNQHKPADLNVVVHSASGGSGSVIGPLVVNELLSNEETKDKTLVIMIGDATSLTYAENTLKTIQSYYGISQNTQCPVPCLFYQNHKEIKHEDVNHYILRAVEHLTWLFSGLNKGLDSQDLKNFLNYTNLHDYIKPSLVPFSITTEGSEMDQYMGNVITGVTLSKEMYNGHFFSENVSSRFQGLNDHFEMPMHYAICDGLFTQLANDLNESIKKGKDTLSSKVDDSDILQGKTTDNTGLVL